MRRALIVGIDDYIHVNELNGCVNDAIKMTNILKENDDSTKNFDCKLLLGNEFNCIDADCLRENVYQLFAHEADVALLYFSGHGSLVAEGLGGYLVSQEARDVHHGFPMEEILKLANGSKGKIKEVVVILDCCHSGAMGNDGTYYNQATLREGISILTASRTSEYAIEVGGEGIFTTLIHDALNGGAADVLGNITVASVYGYADQALGAWDQRPLFKSHVSKLQPLRRCKPIAELSLIKQLPNYFPDAHADLDLDPSFEPEAEPKCEENELIFGNLQKLRAAGLVTPVGEEHMYYAAINSKSCRLTPLGRYYWTLVNEDKL
ncbi:caspase family protein [Bacillus haynesii]|uniref:caspase family protein n=1 Tax=Bacillus haynesii TaxID=1925021 RepID=UPI00227DA8E6|nr:caspase family protein [Bacillus haynesii]MCY8380406.1 caspase family protein [Bacillus haynesii]MEC0675586.1 caspase family protein [Bacillus haynesii]